MKKIVFLFALIVTLVPKNISAEQSQSFILDNYTINIEETYIDGGIGITIEKQGPGPFQTTYRTYGERYYIKGVVIQNDQIILYGSVHVKDEDTYFDSIVLVFTEYGTFEKKIIVDHGDLEEIEQVFYVDGVYVMQTVQHTDMNEEYHYKNNYFTTYDDTFTKINQIEVSREILTSKQENSYLLFSYDYDDYYEFGLTSNLEVIQDDDLIEVEENFVFTSAHYLRFINSGYLNGETISNGYNISYPGLYTFIYNDNENHFKFDADVRGVEDGGVYSEGLTIYFNGGNALLDNDVINSGHHVTLPGEYQLTVNGLNGYLEQYNFTITSNMDGVVNNHIYDDLVNVSFNGEGYLNNQFVESPIFIENEGEYVLKILGENNYMETYFFSVEKEKKDMSFLGFVQKFDVVVLVVTVISGAIILKKK